MRSTVGRAYADDGTKFDRGVAILEGGPIMDREEPVGPTIKGPHLEGGATQEASVARLRERACIRIFPYTGQDEKLVLGRGVALRSPIGEDIPDGLDVTLLDRQEASRDRE